MTYDDDSQFIKFNIQFIFGLRQINGAHIQESDANIQSIIKNLNGNSVQPENIHTFNPLQRI